MTVRFFLTSFLSGDSFSGGTAGTGGTAASPSVWTAGLNLGALRFGLGLGLAFGSGLGAVVGGADTPVSLGAGGFGADTPVSLGAGGVGADTLVSLGADASAFDFPVFPSEAATKGHRCLTWHSTIRSLKRIMGPSSKDQVYFA